MLRIVFSFTAIIAAAAVLGAVACGEDDGGSRTIGNLSFNDHGTTDARGDSELGFEADSFYFGPTFVRGDANQKLTLQIENESDTIHSFTMESLGIDVDIPAKSKLNVEVTFPESGVALFICKYHANSGMRGELLVGDAAPAAVAQGASNDGGGGAAIGAGAGSNYGY